MNSEIKFRGISIKTGEWVYGSLLTNRLGFRICIMINGYINDDTNFYKIRVKSKTVGQFTGLYDRNGKEAYYGDIIQYVNTNGDVMIRKLEYDNEMCCLTIGGMEYSRLRDSGLTQSSNINFLIIGNIHDNPELLPIKIN